MQVSFICVSVKNCYNFSAECVEMNDTVINFYVQLLACFFAVWGQGAKKLIEEEKGEEAQKTTDSQTTAAFAASEASVPGPSTSKEGTVKLDFSETLELPTSELFNVQETCMNLLRIR